MGEIFLASSRDGDFRFCSELAAHLGFALRRVQKAEDCGPALRTSKDAHFFVESATDGELDQLHSKLIGTAPGRTYLIASPEELEQRNPFTMQKLCENLVVRKFGDPKHAASLLGKAMTSAEVTGKAGLARFGFSGTEIHRFEIKDYLQKSFAASAANQLLVDSGFSGRVSASIANAVDEVLMNAILDAPTGKSPPTSDAIDILKSAMSAPFVKPISFEAGIQGNCVAFSVTDQYGTLNPSTVLEYTSRAFSSKLSIRQGSIGAGLGLSNVFRAGASLVYFTVPGKLTEVVALFSQVRLVKDLKDQFQFAIARRSGC